MMSKWTLTRPDVGTELLLHGLQSWDHPGEFLPCHQPVVKFTLNMTWQSNRELLQSKLNTNPEHSMENISMTDD